MGQMIMEFKIMVYDGVVNMIGLEQVLERSRVLFWSGLDIMNFDRGNSYGLIRAEIPAGHISV
jgi:hypothetical protein